MKEKKIRKSTVCKRYSIIRAAIMEDIGTDISAVFWKKCQNVQLQKQLDQSHSIGNRNSSNENDKNKIKGRTKRRERKISKSKLKLIKRLNIDLYFKIKEKKRRKSHASLRKLNKKFSQIKILIIFRYLSRIYKQCVDDLKRFPNRCANAIIKRNVYKYLIYNNVISLFKKDKIYQNDMFNIFSYIAHFIDCRKCKLYVRYMLSDGVERVGIILGHPIFPAIPMWVFDVVRLVSKNEKLHFVYSTDTRNVAKWFGHLTSLVNLSNLLYLKIERGNADVNATLILLHLGGIFTKNLADPINRQGMKYPCNVLQKTTFENVKNQLLKVSKEKRLYDNLSSFISSTIMCVPRVTGTNSFQLTT